MLSTGERERERERETMKKLVLYVVDVDRL